MGKAFVKTRSAKFVANAPAVARITEQSMLVAISYAESVARARQAGAQPPAPPPNLDESALAIVRDARAVISVRSWAVEKRPIMRTNVQSVGEFRESRVSFVDDPHSHGFTHAGRQNGYPTEFITVGYVDGACRVRMMRAAVRFDYKNDYAHLDAKARALAWQTLGTDPVSAAMSATLFVRNFIDKLVLGGIFGKVKHYFFSAETQQRGSLHWHALLWIVGAPTTSAEARRRIDADATLKGRVVNWIDGIVTESYPPMPEEFDVVKVRSLGKKEKRLSSHDTLMSFS